MNWPQIKPIENLEDAKSLFRLANTQFKRALSYFVLDGFVTENVTINQAISQCYRHLTKLEPERKRIATMHLKRIEILELMQNELNPNTY